MPVILALRGPKPEEDCSAFQASQGCIWRLSQHTQTGPEHL